MLNLAASVLAPVVVPEEERAAIQPVFQSQTYIDTVLAKSERNPPTFDGQNHAPVEIGPTSQNQSHQHKASMAQSKLWKPLGGS